MGARPSSRPPGHRPAAVHGVQTLDDAKHLLHARRVETMSQRRRRRRRLHRPRAGRGLRRARSPRLGHRGGAARAGDDARRATWPCRSRTRCVASASTCASACPSTGFDDRLVLTDAGPIRADLSCSASASSRTRRCSRRRGSSSGVRDAVKVDQRQRASVDGVWAAGDCAESFHLVSRRPVSHRARHGRQQAGRVAGINIGGGYATFPGVRRHRNHEDLFDTRSAGPA